VEVMTPWPGQTMTINNQECAFGGVGEWNICRVSAPGSELHISIGRVGRLPSGEDPRSLGVALRGLKWE
jgi:hypothetical protein